MDSLQKLIWINRTLLCFPSPPEVAATSVTGRSSGTAGVSRVGSFTAERNADKWIKLSWLNITAEKKHQSLIQLLTTNWRESSLNYNIMKWSIVDDKSHRLYNTGYEEIRWSNIFEKMISFMTIRQQLIRWPHLVPRRSRCESDDVHWRVHRNVPRWSDRCEATDGHRRHNCTSLREFWRVTFRFSSRSWSIAPFEDWQCRPSDSPDIRCQRLVNVAQMNTWKDEIISVVELMISTCLSDYISTKDVVSLVECIIPQPCDCVPRTISRIYLKTAVPTRSRRFKTKTNRS